MSHNHPRNRSRARSPVAIGFARRAGRIRPRPQAVGRERPQRPRRRTGAWCCGYLGRAQPLWRHSDPTDWTQGYGVQLVRPNGDFLHINTPIIEGKSYLTASGLRLAS